MTVARDAHMASLGAILRQLWRLLAPAQRRDALVQALLMVLGMVLEMFSIGLVVPLLALLSRPDLADGYPTLLIIQRTMGISSHADWVVVTLFAFLAFYVFKTAFLAYLAWRQAWFTYSVQDRLSRRMFALYLQLPYTFHLQQNSAQLVRNVTLETATVSETFYFGMQLTTEILVLLGIGVLLVVAEPLGALAVVGVLGVAGWGFLYVTHRRIAAWGLAQQRHQGLRLQHLQQGLGSVKDVKLLGCEMEFIARYGEHTSQALRASQYQLTLQQLPRLWLEFLAVGGLVTLVLIMVSEGRPLDALLPTLGLFAAAAFRLMPSVSRVINAIQTLRFGLPAIGNLNRELDRAEALDQPANMVSTGEQSRFSSLIEAQFLAYRYPGTDRFALMDIDLTIARGESVGLIGASGAGKSTLVDVLLGLLPPTSGYVRIDGRDMTENLRAWQCQIGYVPQSIYLTDDTLRRNVAFGLPDAVIDDAAVWKALEAARLADFVRAQPEGLDLVVGERGVRLSGGQRQRIGIARALYHDPAVLVLDEATSALDTDTEAGVMEAVGALKGAKTLVIITHRQSTLGHCDRIYRLDGGRIVADPL